MAKWSSTLVENRIAWLIAIIGAFLAVLVAKLWWMQVVNIEYYTQKAKSNRTRLIRDRAQRGRILDRFGRPLATTRPSFSVFVTPEDFPRAERSVVFDRLAELLDIPREDIVEHYRSRQTRSFIPRKLAGGLDFETVVRIETHRYELPGVFTAADNIRYYPYGELSCHLIGHVGEISRRQLESPRFKNYTAGDTVGKTGVEAVFEHVLNGRNGRRWVEVDALGRIKRTLAYPKPVPALPGADLELTIDLDLQQAVEQALAPWNGAVIVMDPRNGDILAMTSRPGFDLNWFASGISREQWKALNEDPDHPLFNRCIQQTASPGSVFKIVTTTAGFRAGTLTEETTHFCNGRYVYNKSVFKCWKRGGHGMTDVVKAIGESCNVFFYQEGLKCGIDMISETAHLYGLGEKTGIILPGEKSGLIPDRAWKRMVLHDEWWPGETISVAIGQGGVTVTPIQLAGLISAVANRGDLYRPRLVRRALAPPGDIPVPDLEPKLRHHIDLPRHQWDLLTQGLLEVTTGEHGTARAIRMKEMVVAGKTGTAQVISEKALKKLGYTAKDCPDKYKDNNWFAGFGPVDDPQVAVVVFIEHGGKEGAKAKVRIARKIFLAWYGLYHPGRFGPEPPPAKTEVGG